MPIRRDLHQANRESWNAATAAHNRHKRAQAEWLAAGGELLFSEDYALLGELAGKRLLHVQCNSGQDSLCLARRGAAVTGIDISDEAVEFANALARDSGIPGSFERGDLYDWLPRAAADGRAFDVVYSSYGWLGWLSDLDAWARGIASVLAPGGRFVGLEFHPFMWLFDAKRKLTYPYFGARQGDVIANPDGVGDYVAEAGEALAPSGFVATDDKFTNPHPVHEFAWALADLFGALRNAGLVLEQFEEWDYTNGCRPYDDLVRVDDEDGRRWTSPPELPRFPMMMGVVFRKPA
jgi:SAM-dependent methyltransferase